MKRFLFFGAGVAVIMASYMVVIFRLPASPDLSATSLASIAFPAFVAGLVMTAFIAFEARGVKSNEGVVHELHAQLAKKEIEIGRLSSMDELTGLYTRHYFDGNLDLEYARVVRHGRPLSLLLIEVDDLEGIGEQAGMLSKGYLLSEVGGILRGSLRINDLGCRHTTERLAVLMPETDADGMRVAAERLRAALREREFLARRQGAGFRLTISQGGATVPSASITSHYDLLRAAETALGEARLAGADQIRITPAAAATPSSEDVPLIPDRSPITDDRLVG